MQKTAMLLPYEFEIVFKSLPLEQAGKLILAIYAYEQNKIEPNFSDNPMLKFAWETHVKPKIQENVEKYEMVCEKRKASGSKGGRPRKQVDDNKPNDFTENQKNQMVFEKAKEPDGDGDGDGDGDIKENILKEKSPITDDGHEIIKLFEERFGMISSYKAMQLQDLIDDFGKDAVAYAIKQANISSTQSIRYIRATAMSYSRRVEDGKPSEHNATNTDTNGVQEPQYGAGIVI